MCISELMLSRVRYTATVSQYKYRSGSIRAVVAVVVAVVVVAVAVAVVVLF